MFSNDKKKLIIVYDKKTKEYAELLSALILMKDDKYDENGCLLKNGIVGVRDGSVDVALWDETTYSKNEPQLSSTTKIVFIGDGKIFKPIKANINMTNELSKFGINYGSLGNKAVICVDSKMITKDRNLYNSFFESYVNFISTIGTDYSDTQKVEKTIHIADYDDERNNDRKKLINAPIKLLNRVFKKKDKKEETTNGDVVVVDESKDLIPEASDGVAKGFGVAGHVIRVLIPCFLPAEVIEVVGHGVIKSKYDKEIIDQQYGYGVFSFYIKKLAKFME